MENASFIVYIIIASAPFFSAFTWGLILLLSFKDSLTIKEVRIKRTLLSFFFFSAIGWASIFIYAFLPQYFIYINSLAYLSLLIGPILFYKFIRVITIQNSNNRYSWLHFISPLLISTTLFIWSFFVPADVQHSLVLGRGVVYPGWEVYSRFFLSKPIIRVVFTFVYMVLSFKCLYKDYYRIRPNQENADQIKHWLILLMAFTVTLFLASLVPLLSTRSDILRSAIYSIMVCFFICQHIVLTYMVIGRKFFTLITVRTFSKNLLSKNRLERWLRKYKPYHDPDLKLADLADSLHMDAGKLSRFINSTYGMTFSRYINQHRLKEVQRLGRLPSNTGKSLRELVKMAGFSSYRSYVRVKDIFDNPQNSGKE